MKVKHNSIDWAVFCILHRLLTKSFTMPIGVPCIVPLILFLIGSSFEIKSQNYLPLFSDTSTWTFGGDLDPLEYALIRSDDTLIGTETYSRLVDDRIGFICYMRYDSINGRAFTLLPEATSINQERVFLDFSLEKGESVDLYSIILDDFRGQFTVDSVYYASYFGTSRKTIELTGGLKWIEGIGTTSLFAEHYEHPDFNFHKELLCAFKNGNKVYENPRLVDWDGNCYLTFKTQGLQNSANTVTSLYPIPAQSQITVEHTTEIQHHSIISPTGISFNVDRKTNQGHSVFDITQLPQGVYILYSTHLDGEENVMKFVKE